MCSTGPKGSMVCPDMLWETRGLALRPPVPILLRATLLPSTGKIPGFTDEETSGYWRQRSPLLSSRMQKTHDFSRTHSTVPSHHICHHRGPSSAWWAAIRMWGWRGRLAHRPRGLIALFGLIPGSFLSTLPAMVSESASLP